MSDAAKIELITQVQSLPPVLRESLSEAELSFIATLESKGLLPFAVTPFYAALAGSGADDPIRKQCIPDPREAERKSYELDDPLGESHYAVSPRFVHQYRDRALLLSNGTCAGYCRHCFRRSWTGAVPGFIRDAELDSACSYLAAQPELREILVSGGDPLVAANSRLEALFARLRSASPDILLRICTRLPIVHPARIDAALVALLRRFRPLRMIVHINHPRELSSEARAALSSCVDAGIPVHTQTVLLKGINDDARVLTELFREITTLGASPYYLFQGDLAQGTSHLRVNLEEALSLYSRLRQLVSGLCLPMFAVDLPGGGGKLALHPACIAGKTVYADGSPAYLLRDADGKLWKYPVEL